MNKQVNKFLYKIINLCIKCLSKPESTRELLLVVISYSQQALMIIDDIKSETQDD